MNEKTSPAHAPNIICLFTDRLHLGFLGAYGNSWIGTGAFDRLASESVLFDRFFASSLALPSLCGSYWTGREPFDPPEEPKPNLSEKRRGLLGRLLRKDNAVSSSALPAELARAGYRTVLATDDTQIAELGSASSFGKVLRLDPAECIAESVEKTAFHTGMSRAAAAALRLNRSETPFFLWVHLKGWEGNWDVPHSLRGEAREDDGDPAPYEGALPPWFEVSEKERGSDAVRAVAETYAAGMRLWDLSLERFLDSLVGGGVLERSALFVGGTRGIPLGEHRRLGVSAEVPGDLYFEETHVPLLYRPPGRGGEAVRSFGLCGPSDLYRALRQLAVGETDRKNLLDLASEREESIRAHLSLTQADADSPRQGVITEEWFFLRDTGTVPASRELYLCPDDRWNVNEVADRAGEEVPAELERKIGRGGFA